jgi:hypothetical protein
MASIVPETLTRLRNGYGPGLRPAGEADMTPPAPCYRAVPAVVALA